ncbi:MAG: bifunctional ADP-dependent NAD(P)H-hydrate dehydratase/NAD(P)H-hydrate epimerase [archaeon]|nr:MULTISPECIES: bifunctional ADP-dependent NAD(P)H-hydrate dehydratase/NAD(P)H-hydrate epimerase [Methanobrevibacter]MCQ2970202.1 bifunctional ADP-dependent NAD(P)H-hydrate dehydratase/NAD(P)H-hydrate epimerase [archaeon]OEC93847.1 bifunctional ADP-dependent (S)-NAD(P)H-hydrate dehydratase/NAD(P)H-hydrate epimerase [Methanobrevibacter sp. A27]
MDPLDMMVTDYNCEYLGLSRLCLMESAGKSLAEEVGKIAVYTFAKPIKVVIFTGSGGNGGDGFVAARYLLNRGYDVDIYMLKDNIRSEDAKTNLEILKNMKPRLSRLNIFNLKTLDDINNCEVVSDETSDFIIVDCLLGTGIDGNLQTNIKRAIEVINESNGLKISVDVPSGMNPLTGVVDDLAVIPDYTISFHKIKTGVRNADEEAVGGIITADIGIPFEAEYFVNYGDFLRLKNRDSDSHKGNNGRLLIVGGSANYSGAPAIAGMAAIGAGADLVHVAAPEKAAEAIKATSPDLIVNSLEGDELSLEHGEEIIRLSENVDAILIGPGAGISDSTSKLFNLLVAKIKKPIVLDADALKQVELSLIRNREDIILTPHIFEFKSFFKVKNDLKLDIDSYDFKKVDENITEIQFITNQIKGTVIVKGKYDLILSENNFKINKSGNSGMTVGGTGDALSGIVVSLSAQGLNAFDAASLAVFINGLAGDRAFDEKGNGFSATDLVSFVGNVIKDGLC